MCESIQEKWTESFSFITEISPNLNKKFNLEFFMEMEMISVGQPTKWSHILKQFAGCLPTNCLSVFDHFAGLGIKGLI